MDNTPQTEPTNSSWDRLPALPGRSNPCGCCPPIEPTFPMDGYIAVGFGSAYLERDGEMIWDGEATLQNGQDTPTGADAEKLAAADPDHDWRIVLHGPLHGETFQRQGAQLWVLVEKNQGFA